MIIDQPNHIFDLNDVEIETLRRSALERSLPFDAHRRQYSSKELADYGLCREAYNSPELQAMGIGSNEIVTSFDDKVRSARDKLLVDTPFADGIRKWQLPIDICEWRPLITEFPPSSVVEPHVHPANTKDDPGGSLRMILKGSIDYAGRTFGPGDWFYVPNGVPYSFKSDEHTETTVMYLYRFFAVAQGNRFSHPIELHRHRTGDRVVA